MPIDHDRRRRVGGTKERRWNGPASQRRQATRRAHRRWRRPGGLRRDFSAASILAHVVNLVRYFLTSMTAVAVRPKTSGSYISSRVGRRRAERSGRRCPDDVGELVAAFAQSRGEQLDAIVVAFDVIEAAALPPGRTSCPTPSRLRPAACESVAADVANHDSTGFEPGGQRIGDGDEAPLLGELERQRDAHEIAGLERRRRRLVPVST